MYIIGYYVYKFNNKRNINLLFVHYSEQKAKK